MCTVRCSICRQQVPTLKALISHYLTGHSKLKVIKQLLKCNVLQSTPNFAKRKFKRRTRFKKPKNVIKLNPRYVKTETLYLNENIHILCSENEIIIGDDEGNVDMEFSFDETKKNCYAVLKDTNANIITNTTETSHNSQPASSEDSTDTLEVIRKKIRRKKEVLQQSRHYRIDITKLKDRQTLDDSTGEFYVCHCRENMEEPVATTSDTESCSDPDKTVWAPVPETQIFCYKCGIAYNTEADLANHMQVHETFCRLCNEHFPDEYAFKEHMRLHFFKVYMCHECGREFPFRELLRAHFERHAEEKILETVLDMEEDYPTTRRYDFLNTSYDHSINNILCYLTENRDVYYYSYKYAKVTCEICSYEVFLCDYDRHLMNVHHLCPL